ncbi:hypothetical protein CYJ76_09420 [Kytococcus schroeteri]|uniref:Uncharacterized protein n=1 Tax=Kytococcus schroeteri TaxID=138300 RepID=A0A2I1P947_9MICO|nr:hypothetical protein [Kytococcus schroeteri]PKZ41143.1 hypothetical protein CYJ76_09420 [Kytococcus schroeteri]
MKALAQVTLRRLWTDVVHRAVRVAQLSALFPLLVAVGLGIWATLDLPGPPLWAWLGVPLAVLAGLRLTTLFNARRVHEALDGPEATIDALARRIPGMGTGESTRARPGAHRHRGDRRPGRCRAAPRGAPHPDGHLPAPTGR